jgi:FkbM family methyltransferase
MDRRWASFGESIAAFCFEADAAECARLNAQGLANVKFIPEVIAGANGIATLYQTKFQASSGLYRVNEGFFGRLLNADNATLLGTQAVTTKTLDLVREEYQIPEPDFIKLDVEGAELDILRATNLGGTFGVLTEFRFHEEINGSAPFWQLDAYMRSQGFMLYDITVGRQSRKALPYPGPKLNYTNGERFYAATERGQVMDGDAVYFRDPVRFGMDRMQILRAACLFEVFGLKDCAAEILKDREAEAMVDVDYCLNQLAGGDYKKYLEAY